MPHHNKDREWYRQNRDRLREQDWAAGNPNRDLRRGTIYDRSQDRRGNYDVNPNRYDYQNRNYPMDYPGNWNEQDDYFNDYNDDYDQDFDTDWYGYDVYPTWSYAEVWLVPGPYQGMGPQSYQRSDERILEDVCERLTQHGQLDASDIKVDVNNGEVTLNGNVNSRRDKRVAEDIADTVSGVNDVQNNLHVNKQQNMPQNRRMGWGRTQTSLENQGQIEPGMEVTGSQGGHIGRVEEVQANQLLVDRDNARDVYVPLDAIQKVNNDTVQLTVKADEVDSQGWHNPHEIKVDNG